MGVNNQSTTAKNPTLALLTRLSDMCIAHSAVMVHENSELESIHIHGDIGRQTLAIFKPSANE